MTMDMSFETFKFLLKRKLNLDYGGYRDNQLQRRVNSFMQKQGIGGYSALLKFLRGDPQAVASLRDYLAINVSEFFRNPEMFTHLFQEILPGLNRKTIRMWSAGCSVGCEAYSLGILAQESFLEWSLLATDIDGEALQAAKAGVYERELLKQVPRPYLTKYFSSLADHRCAIKDSLKKKVTFKYLDLFRGPYPMGMDLIACRNVVIYFTEAAKDEVFARLCNSLQAGGLLFLGATESFHNYLECGMKRLHPCIYQKI